MNCEEIEEAKEAVIEAHLEAAVEFLDDEADHRGKVLDTLTQNHMDRFWLEKEMLNPPNDKEDAAAAVTEEGRDYESKARPSTSGKKTRRRNMFTWTPKQNVNFEKVFKDVIQECIDAGRGTEIREVKMAVNLGV